MFTLFSIIEKSFEDQLQYKEVLVYFLKHFKNIINMLYYYMVFLDKTVEKTYNTLLNFQK